MPGWMPSLAKVIPILASATAMRMSQASAMHSPAPMAWPLMAAMVGMGRLWIAR